MPLNLLFVFKVEESEIKKIEIFDSSFFSLNILESTKCNQEIEDYFHHYFQGIKKTLPLKRFFSPFATKVYDFLEASPIGKTYTYKQVAEQIGCPKGYRAVGNSLNKNPFPLAIPCHQVISNKDLGGFAFGKRVKEKLLVFEKDLSLART